MMTIHGNFTLEPGETWRDVVARIAEPHGLAAAVCLAIYDSELPIALRHYGEERGAERAAWQALYGWDCLPLSALSGLGGN